jgi:phosphoribosylanthranilate isomerase
MSAPVETGLPAVKVCGLMRPEDAVLAGSAGAAYGGVILAPGYRRSVTAEAARVIFRNFPGRGVGVFVDAGEDDLLRAAGAAGLHAVQLHGNEPPSLADRVRSEGFETWKAVRVRSPDDVAAAFARYAGAADALLLDGWDPAAAGGTGTRFDWMQIAALRGDLPGGMRLVAAGGLRPENVAEAVRILRPHVVDVSSGVESAPGVKDPDAVRAFVRAARGPSPSSLI